MDGIVGDDGIRRYYGKYPGLVLDNKAPTSGEHRGDLEVEVAGLLEDDPGQPGRRALQVTAQPCFPPGLFWIPAAGQPVWVEFVGGRIDRAVWCGVWYTGTSTPRTVDGAAPQVAHKVLRTAGGHVVQFEDPADRDQDPGPVIVADANGNRITLGRGNVEVCAKPADGDGPEIVLRTSDDKAKVTIATAGGAGKIVLATGDAQIIIGPDGITVTDGTNTIATSASATGAVTLTDGNHNSVKLSTAGVEVNGSLVALRKLADLFAGHTHLTSLGPAALNPKDQADCLIGEQLGTVLSGPKVG